MLINTEDYLKIVKDIKQQIYAAQFRVVDNVNAELIMLYWNIGKSLNARKKYGNKFIESLAKDLRLEFPKAKGYSARNLAYIAKFAAEYQDEQFVKEYAARIPWWHNITVIERAKDLAVRKWYIEKTIENGWSCSVLEHQIETDLYSRQALAQKITNFSDRLPMQQSELAVQTVKDPYIFDFIPFREKIEERELENELIKNVTQFLLELGTGFAFLGNQYHLNVGGDDFYIDLLFYNVNLKCYVVIELKAVEFKPEFAGKLNFYISAVDGILKKDTDHPTIGLLLCKGKNNVVAEYALQSITNPIGVSEYKICKELPKEYVEILPTVEDIENRIK